MGSPAKTLVFLLKTRSGSTDAYEEIFSAPNDDGFDFEPIFVPVLEHRYESTGVAAFETLLRQRQVSKDVGSSYGGLIFTSQRAVEVFDDLARNRLVVDRESWSHLHDIPIYSVGPATSRALRSIAEGSALNVLGEHTGNGENLAQFILADYTEHYPDHLTRPPLLFLVGEQRREVIPKTLMDESLSPDKRITVKELVVYGTGVKTSFQHDFTARLEETSDRATRWTVVFSPTGCEDMLRALGMLDEAGNARPRRAGYNTFIATIGPTTRAFLKERFGIEPDVCSKQPSPQGVWEAITEFSVDSMSASKDEAMRG